MLYADGAVGLLLLGLWLFAIFDVIATEPALCRNLPKMIWLMVVIFLPDVGSIAWLLLGRPERAGFRPGDTTYRASSRPIGPEDSPNYLSRSEQLNARLEAWEADQRARQERLQSRDLSSWEAELQRREEELRRREKELGSEE
jgi:hypothetical protein